MEKPSDETYVALAADHLVAVVLGGKSLERRLDDTTTETENKVKGGFLKDARVSHAFSHLPMRLPRSQP